MRKYLSILLLLVIGGLAAFTFFKFSQPDTGAWKYEKNIKQPITATAGSTDTTMGDLSTHKVTLTIPKNSYDSDTQLTLKNPDTVPNYITGEVETIGAPIEIISSSKARLNEKTKITFQFDKASLSSDTRADHLRVAYHNGSVWEYIKPLNVDLSAGTITFETYHFCLFGANKITDETKITEAWIHSAAFDKTLRDAINAKSDYITNQIVDMMLKKMGVSDESAKGKILADILKDDGYKDVVKAYASGNIVDGGQKVAALAGSKIVELVPESTLSKALGSIAGSPDDIAAAGKALGSIAAGQYKDAAKIIGEQIADKFLITTAGKIAVEVINVQIDSWKNAEVEAAFQAYKNGANGAFWGYNVDKLDFDAVWMQMKGASRQLELEAIAKENAVRADAGMPALTEAETEAVRAKVKDSYRTQFETRIEKDAEIKKNEENLRAMVGAFQKANFFTDALAPTGFDKGLDYENKLSVLSHFMTKMMKDTGRFDLSDKTGLLVNDKLSLEDLVQGARFYFGAANSDEGKKAYAKFLQDRFGILPYPPLAQLAGNWKGTMTVTAVEVPDTVPEEVKQQLKDEGCEELNFDEITIEDLKKNLNESIGKAQEANMTITPTSESGGTITSSGDAAQTMSFTYTDGVIRATLNQKGATATVSLTPTPEGTAYILNGTMHLNVKEFFKLTAALSLRKQ